MPELILDAETFWHTVHPDQRLMAEVNRWLDRLVPWASSVDIERTPEDHPFVIAARWDGEAYAIDVLTSAGDIVSLVPPEPPPASLIPIAMGA